MLVMWRSMTPWFVTIKGRVVGVFTKTVSKSSPVSETTMSGAAST